MYCQQCGAEADKYARYCPQCGDSLDGVQKEPGSEQVQDDTAQNEAFYEASLGYKKLDFYLPKFFRFDANGIGASWNWAAFFLNWYWLLYRKMWAVSFAYLGVTVLFGIAQATAGESLSAVGALILLNVIVLWGLFPAYANALYYRHVNKKIAKVKKTVTDKDRQLRILQAEGGTSSIVLVLIVIFLLTVFTGILAAIAIPAYQDYVVRTKVVSGLTLAERYKTEVENYVYENQAWPYSITEFEDMPSANESPYVRDIAIHEAGVIVVTYASEKAIAGRSLALIPSINEAQRIVWQCQGVDIEQKYLPTACRKQVSVTEMTRGV